LGEWEDDFSNPDAGIIVESWKTEEVENGVAAAKAAVMSDSAVIGFTAEFLPFLIGTLAKSELGEILSVPVIAH
jgi:hypothetical protein